MPYTLLVTGIELLFTSTIEWNLLRQPDFTKQGLFCLSHILCLSSSMKLVPETIVRHNLLGSNVVLEKTYILTTFLCYLPKFNKIYLGNSKNIRKYFCKNVGLFWLVSPYE